MSGRLAFSTNPQENGVVKTHYLIGRNCGASEERISGEFGCLLPFSPGPRDAGLTVTIWCQNREPGRNALNAPAGQNSEPNYGGWPILPDVRFAIQVGSSEPVVCPPGDEQPQPTLASHCQDQAEHQAIMPPRCLRVDCMDSVARHNSLYGVHFQSDQPVVVQWWRAVNWNHSDELMACRPVPGPLE